MPQSGKYGSVGALGEQSPRATRPECPPECLGTVADVPISRVYVVIADAKSPRTGGRSTPTSVSAHRRNSRPAMIGRPTAIR
jgi:hypothetical protein